MANVRVYHGRQKLPKTHVVRMRLSMPATSDYWVNDVAGDPLSFASNEVFRRLASLDEFGSPENAKVEAAGGRREVGRGREVQQGL